MFSQGSFRPILAKIFVHVETVLLFKLSIRLGEILYDRVQTEVNERPTTWVRCEPGRSMDGDAAPAPANALGQGRNRTLAMY